MIKLNYWLTVLLCSIAYLDAMELPIVAHKSLDSIRSYVGQLPKKQQRNIHRQLSQSLIFNVAQLPAEIRKDIITIMCGGDAHVANLFCKVPMIHAVYFFNESAQCLPLEFGGKHFTVGQLLRLSLMQRNELVRIAKPSLLLSLVGVPNSFVDEERYNVMRTMPGHIKEEVELYIADQTFFSMCSHLYPAVFVLSTGIVLSTVIFCDHISPFSKTCAYVTIGVGEFLYLKDMLKSYFTTDERRVSL